MRARGWVIFKDLGLYSFLGTLCDSV